MGYADKILKRLKSKIDSEYKRNKIESTLCLMSAMAKVQYIYNQRYKDDYLEQLLKKIALSSNEEIKHNEDKGKVLFYDGFGADNRGLVQIYLKALIANGYKVVYVTQADTLEMQPQVMSIVNREPNTVYHYSGQNMTEKIGWLDKIFYENSFSTAFFYTTPWDVSGTIAFEHLENKCTRFQINLTDHAFWIGVNAFDYSLEFRNYGAAISRDYRAIKEEKLLYLPYYPIIRSDIEFQGFPFDCNGKKVIFSGGEIYKTIDKNNTYYNLVDQILSKNTDVIFMFASSDTNTQLNMLINRYPDQVIYVKERKDLIKVLENSYLYLNTYPISGALMIQYAAVAGCIPVTLRRPWDDDAFGLLKEEDKLGEIFEDFDSVLSEINRLLSDEVYYKKKKNLLKNQVISEKDFQYELNEIISNPESRRIENISAVNTTKFIETYRENILEKQIIDAVINLSVKNNVWHFPDLFVKKMFLHCYNWLKNKRSELC